MNTDLTASPETTPTPHRSRAALVWLIVTQGIALLTLVPWFYLAALSALELQSSDAAAGSALPLLLLAYPIVPLVCSVAAWLLYRSRRFIAAAIAMPIPIVIMGLSCTCCMVQRYKTSLCVSFDTRTDHLTDHNIKRTPQSVYSKAF